MLDMTTVELNERLAAAMAENRSLRAQLDDKEGPIKIELKVLKNEFDKLKSSNADLSHQRDAAMETNDRLLIQLDDKDGEIEKLKAEADATIADQKKRIEGQARTIGELEDKLNNAAQNYALLSEQLDVQLSDNIRLQFQRDTWKKIAKWLIKQMGGCKHG